MGNVVYGQCLIKSCLTLIIIIIILTILIIIIKNLITNKNGPDKRKTVHKKYLKDTIKEPNTTYSQCNAYGSLKRKEKTPKTSKKSMSSEEITIPVLPYLGLIACIAQLVNAMIMQFSELFSRHTHSYIIK